MILAASGLVDAAQSAALVHKLDLAGGRLYGLIRKE